MADPALTPDERRIVEWLRRSADECRTMKAPIYMRLQWAFWALTKTRVFLGAATYFRANQIESLARRKAEDADR